jgi:enoyl-[acyl-carrier protein] reductase II
VVAAGGIFDGRGLVAALALGAVGVWLGTRFIATPEARGVRGYKERLLATAEDGTTISRAYSGKTMRVLRNTYTEEFETSRREVQRFPMQAVSAMQEGVMHLGGDEATEGVDPDRECYPAGQAVGGIEALEPAGDIVRRIVAEADDVLRRLDPTAVSDAR